MRPRTRPGLTTSELPGGEVVVATPDHQRATILNAMASAVLDLCDGSRSSTEIARFIGEHLPDADPERVSRDVAEVLRTLEEAGLVEDAEACNGSSSAD